MLRREDGAKLAERHQAPVRRTTTVSDREASQAEVRENSFLAALCHTYADLLRRQRTAATPFARWSKATRRAHEFVWLGGRFESEPLLLHRESLTFGPTDPLYEAVHKMYGTAKLNPYEREILYGFPYVIGRVKGKPVRGPLLTLSIEITPQGDHLSVQPADEVVRFNSLPFRTDVDTESRDQALARIIEATPALPLSPDAVRDFASIVSRELPHVEIRAQLTGTLVDPPSEPKSGEFLAVIDQAAVFVAPKTNYFLRSDLENIAQKSPAEIGALEPLLSGAGEEEQVDFTNEEIDTARLFFPFPANRAQRRTALLAADPTTRLVRVEGPPGTGKSLTIANLACHLAAEGKRVLITSQKDKALEVVDEKLRELGLAELPMTLLRHDRESKRDLLNRLDGVEKRRPRAEVEEHHSRVEATLGAEVDEQLEDAEAYAQSLLWEDRVERAQRALQVASRLRRLPRRWSARRALRSADKRAPETTDQVAERVAARRDQLRRMALASLQLGLERGVSGAKRGERQVVREMQDILKRDQRSHRNFSLFDRLKQQTDTAHKLLRILPVWIVSPDDAARLFPCEPGLFDVVIIDEASQVDLPSILPMAYRGEKVLIFGDTKQMQSRRFAFMSRNVALEAWEQFGMDKLDPDQRLHPFERSLLGLASIHAEEECLLDEHFRSLPPIIDFSNERWYRGALRIMTDPHQKRFGSPDQPIIQLHRVEEGVISNGSQENEAEAGALVEFLGHVVKDPDYADASIGVLCLFEEQVALVHELVTDSIDADEWDEHSIVVVNPDGFQGDERDVILYSLSWDNNVMPQAALSARQMDTSHIQGMLNVAFTRARDEIHLFHSAPVETFGMAGGRSGALGDWMAYCASVENEGGGYRVSSRHDRIDSEFEAQVAEALRARGVRVMHQYPACGFSIDLVCEQDGRRVAVECDGELYHLDEHGNLRIEDIERQAILERAGWRVLRIAYRSWIRDPEAQLDRVINALVEDDDENEDEDFNRDSHDVSASETAPTSTHRVTKAQLGIIEAVRQGRRLEDDVLRFARGVLGYKRLGPRIRERLVEAAVALNHLGLLVIEDGEYFLTAKGRAAELIEIPPEPPKPKPRKAPARRSYRRSRSRSRYRYGYRYRRY